MVLTGPLGLGGVSSAGAEALGFLDSSLFCETEKREPKKSLTANPRKVRNAPARYTA